MNDGDDVKLVSCWNWGMFGYCERGLLVERKEASYGEDEIGGYGVCVTEMRG